MTLQWLAVSYFLYAEMVIALFLILPILKPSLWKRIFQFRIFSTIQPLWSTFFYALLVILIFLFLDSIRQMIKYGKSDSATLVPLDSKLDRLLRECKGQRNFYITGFALFLMLVIKRIITMLSEYASLDANLQALMKQASNANAELTRRIESDERNKIPIPDEEKLRNELKKSQAEVIAMKKKAEATNSEYDRLSSDFQKLQSEIDNSEKKKDV